MNWAQKVGRRLCQESISRSCRGKGWGRQELASLPVVGLLPQLRICAAPSFPSAHSHPCLRRNFLPGCQQLLYYPKGLPASRVLSCFIHSPCRPHTNFLFRPKGTRSHLCWNSYSLPLAFRETWRSYVMATWSPDLLPSPVSLLATRPLELSTSAAQRTCMFENVL